MLCLTELCLAINLQVKPDEVEVYTFYHTWTGQVIRETARYIHVRNFI